MCEERLVDSYSIWNKEEHNRGRLFLDAGTDLPEIFEEHATLLRRNVPLQKGRIGLPRDLERVKRNLEKLGYYIEGKISLLRLLGAERIS